MKPIILTLLLTIPFLVLGQTSGEIAYSENITLNIELPEGMEQFKDMVPGSQELKMVLLFNNKASIYKNAPADESADNEIHAGDEAGGMQFRMKFDMPENQTYTDVKTGKTTEKRDFMDKKFLIEGKAKRYKWNISAEQKTILDYACQKATFQDTSGTIEAWFTSQIPVSAGPASYSGLPGMILEVNIDDGQRIITANSVDMKDLEKKAIEAPKKGKKVSQEEFEAIVEAKTKEMREQYGGDGSVIIKTRRD